jgi:tetraprenyl-beta-curcumene synthase
MSTATRTSNGRPALQPAQPVAPAGKRRMGMLYAAAESLDLSYVFADTVVRYLVAVLPAASRELHGWHARAAAIPDPSLRATALQALRKRGNIEGAALFATLAPAAHRRAALCALIALQSAYNYLDGLSELPSEDPAANADQLHQALVAALSPGAPHPDYYAHNPHRDDGGYLHALLDGCRDALSRLPSYATVAPVALTAAGRIVDFQVLNLSEVDGGHAGMRRWATDATPSASALHWWETAAGAGSSLALHALIAAAADPHLDPWEARQIDAAYFPWAGALHSLLDSLVDCREDHQQGRLSLLGYYPSPTDAAIKLSRLATHARGLAVRLPNPHAHRVIVTAMCSYYLSAPECDTADAQTITRALTGAMGLPLNVAIVMFRSRRVFHTLTQRTYT